MDSKRPQVGVGVIIANQDEKILLAKRMTMGKDLYGLPGGHLEFGESFEECASRELEEETGLIIPKESLKYVGLVNAVHVQHNYHYLDIYIYGSCPLDQSPINMEPEKQSDWIWVSWNELKDFPLFYPLEDFFQKITSFQKIKELANKDHILY